MSPQNCHTPEKNDDPLRGRRNESGHPKWPKKSMTANGDRVNDKRHSGGRRDRWVGAKLPEEEVDQLLFAAGMEAHGKLGREPLAIADVLDAFIREAVRFKIAVTLMRSSVGGASGLDEAEIQLTMLEIADRVDPTHSV